MPKHVRTVRQGIYTAITRDNIDAVLDAGKLYVAINNGNWWQAHRNGQTKRWKRDPSRIRVPFKYGFKNYGAIDESYFLADNEQALLPGLFRHSDDLTD